MDKTIIRFLLQLIILLGFVFAIHIAILYMLEKPLFDHKIIEAYTVNALLAALIFIGLYKLNKTFKEQLGFIFMGGSMLKFLVFFLVFYPSFKDDGALDNFEFASFFIPYIVCLMVETLALIKMLKKAS